MLTPLLGEASIPVVIKIIFTSLVAMVLTPILHTHVPPVPPSGLSFALLILSELMTGVAIGMMVKLTLSALHVAGMVVAHQAGLSAAVIYDPSQAAQGSLFSNLFSYLILVLLMATDLHLILVQAIAESYDKFAINQFSLYYDDFINGVLRAASDAFNLGIKMSMPFIVVGMVSYIGLGILNRLMPQFQVFFVVMPAQILLSIFLLLLTISSLSLWFLEQYREHIFHIFS
jgi:flagellar biosynthetic protein FliR